MARLSAELQEYFFAEDCPPQVKLADILQLAGERTFGFLFVLLAFPSALPLPAPGYSTPFGLVIFLLACQFLSLAHTPWLPAKLMQHPLPLTQVQGVLTAGMPWLQKIEVISRPRLTYICTGRLGRTIIGCAIALMAISMMIPIPGTNTLPAMGIFIAGFGLLDDDGLIALAGLVVCGMGFTLSSSILIALWFGGSSLLDAIAQLISR